MSEEVSELVLITRAKRGNLNAFNDLVLMYQDAVYNTAFRIVGDGAIADDIAQTAFISAWQKFDTFHGEIFRPWILRITINAAYDELRRIRRQRTIPLEPTAPDDDNETIEDAAWMADGSDGPGRVTERKDAIAAISDCLNQMPTDYRSVLTLIDVQELGYQEVSEILGTPLGTIKSRLFRARAKIRDCLKKKEELFDYLKRSDNEEQDGAQ